MRHLRKVKIVATLGPASSTYDVIKDLHQAGADVFRLNMSHGSHAEIRERHRIIREIEKELASPIAILADLQGPKLRVGTFANGQETLVEGAYFQLDLDPRDGDVNRVCLPHREIFSALEVGAHLLVNDGKIRLLVEEFGADFAKCRVIAGGVISNHKGVNVPDVVLPLAALSEKDLKDLEFVCELGVDWLALSFVQRPRDVTEAKELIAGRAAVISKIEKPAAIENFDEILTVSDGIMVARGDLGVELPVQNVPPMQKRMVRKCRAAAKPVIVATQMLESMIDSPMPTRAEVSDVANAVFEGADAVMLSGESAAGAHPLEAVEVMDRVARSVEGDPQFRDTIDAGRTVPETTSADAITAAARQVAETLSASAIVTYTTSGSTALRAARERPPVPTLVLTPSLITARRLAVAWGLSCVHSADASGFTDMVDRACRVAADRGIASSGDRLVITAGVPFGTPGATNTLRVAWVP